MGKGNLSDTSEQGQRCPKTTYHSMQTRPLPKKESTDSWVAIVKGKEASTLLISLLKSLQ